MNFDHDANLAMAQRGIYVSPHRLVDQGYGIAMPISQRTLWQRVKAALDYYLL